jgi:deazaflavin-dependent oxidoreductase (nitroreductase family)
VPGVGEPAHFKRPGWVTKHVVNNVVGWLTRAGISVAGSRVLEVPGRTTGAPHQTPVNLMTVNGTRYLVSPRGHTQWVRNLRAGGRGRLLLGRRSEAFATTEIPDEQKTPFLREYLRRWKFEVGMFFDGVGPDSPDADFARIAPDHPVFRVEPS